MLVPRYSKRQKAVSVRVVVLLARRIENKKIVSKNGSFDDQENIIKKPLCNWFYFYF